MPLILGANSVSGYTVKNSLRFNGGSSDYLTRTPATTGTSRQIMTFSFWTKRSGFETTNAYRLFSTFYSSGANQFWIRFADSGEGIDKISIVSYDSAFSINLITTQVFRDPSAWYHVVVAFDTTQATSTNRVKLYINGTQVTSFSTSTYPSQNYNLQWNVTQPNQICGNGVSGNEYYNGYMSEINFIDGQALTPSSFGETDTLSGIWIPKAYTGTYGTNGFFLKFSNSASLGTDSSGNGNNFTVNNLTSVDQSTDTPTNNFCTLNPLNTQSNVTLSEGNLKQVCTATNNDVAGTTMGVSKGKWYWEIKVIDVDDIDGGTFIGTSAFQLRMDGALTNLTASGTAPSGFVDGDYMGIALDVDNLQVQFYKNGSTNGTACTITSTFDFILPRNGNNRNNFEFNFGSPPFTIASGNTDGAGFGNFEYAPPSGYYALCTKNLANFG